MRILQAFVLAAFAVLGAHPARAQMYPVKPVKIIVSTSPGGVTDLSARILGRHITNKTGQTVVIENRVGASGGTAMEAVAKADPDGYTLGVANTGNIVINPFLVPAMPFDSLKDLAPVGLLGTVPLFLVVNGKLPVASLPEFVAYTKANPDKITYASAGIGTTPDAAAREFAQRAGLSFTTAPYRGTHPAVQALLRGEAQATFVSIGPHIKFVERGKLRVLGAATRQRVSYLPETPTFAEQGFPGFETSTWFALFAPHGTPDHIILQLNNYLRTMQQDPDLRQTFDANFIEPAIMSAADFAGMVRADAMRWERIVRDTMLKRD